MHALNGGRYGTVGYNRRLNTVLPTTSRNVGWICCLLIPINWVPWRLTEEGVQHGYTRRSSNRHELSRHIDVFMDQGQGNHVPPEWIPELQCEYGTSGGLWLYHSVRMHRLSYLLPYPKRACSLIKRDYDRGARACLYYQGPMINPGVEINTAVSGRILSDVTRNPEEVIEEVITEYYEPRTTEAGKTLAGIFGRIEDGYFGRWNAEEIKKAHNLEVPGEFMGWGLFGEEPEVPGHFNEPWLDKAGRLAYKDELIGVLRDLNTIKADLFNKERTARLTDALTLTVQFLKSCIAYKA